MRDIFQHLRQQPFAIFNWNIPEWMEKEIIERDKVCVYCGVPFITPEENHKASPSWEHIVNDARIITLENISQCCMSCNANKGLDAWLESLYCKKKGITFETVADVVKQALENLYKAHIKYLESRLYEIAFSGQLTFTNHLDLLKLVMCLRMPVLTTLKW